MNFNKESLSHILKEDSSESLISDTERGDNTQEIKQQLEEMYSSITLPSGEVYTGPMDDNGIRCGYGLVEFVNGSYYLGECLDDCANGIGKHVSSSGVIRTGAWA